MRRLKQLPPVAVDREDYDLFEACAGGPGSVSSRGEDQREWSEAMRLASADAKRGAISRQQAMKPFMSALPRP